jgi:hypothetical protein
MPTHLESMPYADERQYEDTAPSSPTLMVRHYRTGHLLAHLTGPATSNPPPTLESHLSLPHPFSFFPIAPYQGLPLNPITLAQLSPAAPNTPEMLLRDVWQEQAG